MACFSGRRTNRWNLIYKWFLNGNDVSITYAVNNSGSFSGSFTRVLYIMNMPHISTGKYCRCWVEMDDFTSGDVTKVGVPQTYTYEVNVTNMRYYYSSDGLLFPDADTNTLNYPTGPVTGRLNFWPSNYTTTGGNDGLYDHDDDGYNTTNGYGSFQVFDVTNSNKCVFAWNAWNLTNDGDFGMGNRNTSHTDWTFRYIGNTFSGAYCEAYVQ